MREAWELLVNLFVYAIYAGLIAAVVVPFVLIIGYIVREFRRQAKRNARFLGAAVAAEMLPGGRGQIKFRAGATSQHAVWLDLGVAGDPPRFALEISVTANGAKLTAVSGQFGYDSEGDFQDGEPRVVAGSPFGCSLNNRLMSGLGDTHVRGVQRVAFFTPALGAGITVQAAITALDDTKVEKCRLLVTSTHEPA